MAAVILSLHPFLRAFDNSLMTESITGSLFLISLAAAVSIVSCQGGRRSLAILVACISLCIQFRGYFILFGLAFFCVIVLVNVRQCLMVRFLVPLLIAAFVMASSVYVYPIFRWWKTGKYFSPDASLSLLVLAFDHNPQPSPALLQSLHNYHLPDAFDPESTAASAFRYQPWIHLARKMVDRGQSFQQVDDVFKRMFWEVRLDSSGTIANQLSGACFSIGFPRINLWLSPDHLVRRKLSVAQLQKHNELHYIWLSWLSHADYSTDYIDFLGRFRNEPVLYSPEAVTLYESAFRPNIRPLSIQWRDPLHLSRIPMSLWFLFGCLGSIILATRRSSLALLFLLPVAVNYLVSFYCILGNFRYCYPLLPLYIVAILFFFNWLAKQGLLFFRHLFVRTRPNSQSLSFLAALRSTS